MSAAKPNSSISGMSVALGFVAMGFVYDYLFVNIYGGFTQYLAATLILFGVIFVLFELQKQLTGRNFRFDNGGVGVLLLAPGFFFGYLVNNSWSGLAKTVVLTILSVIILVGLIAAIDLFVSISEELLKAKDVKGKILGVLKFLVICASSIAAIYAAVEKVIR